MSKLRRIKGIADQETTRLLPTLGQGTGRYRLDVPARQTSQAQQQRDRPRYPPSRQHPIRPIIELLLDGHGRLAKEGTTLNLVEEQCSTS